MLANQKLIGSRIPLNNLQRILDTSIILTKIVPISVVKSLSGRTTRMGWTVMVMVGVVNPMDEKNDF